MALPAKGQSKDAVPLHSKIYYINLFPLSQGKSCIKHRFFYVKFIMFLQILSDTF
jgi:hypothetical protein